MTFSAASLGAVLDAQVPAGATGLAALLAYPELFTGRKVGLVLSGGNIDTRLLASVLLRGLVRDGRIVRLRLQPRGQAIDHGLDLRRPHGRAAQLRRRRSGGRGGELAAGADLGDLRPAWRGHGQ